MIEVKSHWRSSSITRLTIVTKDGAGKVQVDLINYDNLKFGRTALIWDLYVREDSRRQGVAKRLMQYAIERSKECGFETASLEWNLLDTPKEIKGWYEKLGFVARAIDGKDVLMVKKL